MWVDGSLIADSPNLRLREVEKLKIDRFGPEVYIGSNKKRENRTWVDNVTTGTSYIGSLTPRRQGNGARSVP